MKDGARKREYIGADPQKVAKPLAAIRRGARYKKTVARRNGLETQITQVGLLVDRLLWVTLIRD